MTKRKPSCRVCGCTDENCDACIDRTGKACHWVEPDLCSACKRTGKTRVAAGVDAATPARDFFANEVPRKGTKALNVDWGALPDLAVVHVLKYGKAICKRIKGEPPSWPHLHHWIGFQETTPRILSCPVALRCVVCFSDYQAPLRAPNGAVTVTPKAEKAETPGGSNKTRRGCAPSPEVSARGRGAKRSPITDDLERIAAEGRARVAADPGKAAEGPTRKPLKNRPVRYDGSGSHVVELACCCVFEFGDSTGCPIHPFVDPTPVVISGGVPIVLPEFKTGATIDEIAAKLAKYPNMQPSEAIEATRKMLEDQAKQPPSLDAWSAKLTAIDDGQRDSRKVVGDAVAAAMLRAPCDGVPGDEWLARPSAFRVLGLDPGLRSLGILVLELTPSSCAVVYRDTFKTTPADGNVERRLKKVGRELLRVVEVWRPRLIGYEKIRGVTVGNEQRGHGNADRGPLLEVCGMIRMTALILKIKAYAIPTMSGRVAVMGKGQTRGSNKGDVKEAVERLTGAQKLTKDQADAGAMAFGAIARRTRTKKLPARKAARKPRSIDGQVPASLAQPAKRAGRSKQSGRGVA